MTRAALGSFSLVAGLRDRDRLEQVFSNLVGNAVHYGVPEKPVSVRGGEEDGTVGGASGPLYGTFFLRLGAALVGVDPIDAPAFGGYAVGDNVTVAVPQSAAWAVVDQGEAN